jgi:protein-S-isoprenylcysteine O-methyltransferase Ste14
MPSVKSNVLVSAQLALIAAMLATGPWCARHPAAQAAETAGLAVGGWAIWTMRRTKLRIAPEVAEGARLVEDGPYRWVRHPMYSAVLLVMGALLADHFTSARAALWLALLLVLLVKLSFEEKLLEKHFTDYAGYRQRTKRLFPFVW